MLRRPCFLQTFLHHGVRYGFVIHGFAVCSVTERLIKSFGAYLSTEMDFPRAE